MDDWLGSYREDRMPGYTDRILFKGDIEATQYDLIGEYSYSDHKAVYGCFKLKPNDVVPEMTTTQYQEVIALTVDRRRRRRLSETPIRELMHRLDL